MSQLVTSEEKEFEYLRQTEKINDRLCRLEQFVKLDSERTSIEFREIRLWREKMDVRMDRVELSLNLIQEDRVKDRELMERVLNILETMQADKQ